MLARHHRFLAPFAVLTALGAPLCINGCSGSTRNESSDGGGPDGEGGVVPVEGGANGEGGVGGPACNVANVGGSNQSKVAVQAINDYAVSATSDRDAVLARCKALAKDLDTPPADQATADALTDPRSKLAGWCSLAVKVIGVTKAEAGGLITIETRAPRCEDSVPAKGACQARCSATGTCDLLANPPKCTGGRLFIGCKGDCTSQAGAALSCVGSCGAACRGECTATSSVECAGTCTGTCTASGSGSGTQADGRCLGTCQGTCGTTAPGASCAGSCNGECGGTSGGTSATPVKCDGKCSGAFDLLTCTGGKLEGGCQVDAKCDAECDVSVAAQAVCPAGTVDVRVSGAANTAAITKLRATLLVNFGPVLSLRAHLEHLSAVAAIVSSSADAISDITPACIPPLTSAAGAAGDEVQSALQAVSSVVASVE